ncbi:hypothetical protein HPP92_010755 [Vanilla planifolia]|uniref:Uncharacterized protein n=1 Tax=Vanilla planifolia TaxID=51239 RepID=A0A835R4Q8_VANPL|nr:hypothetical protein HPP92_010755 [Vanilla planifolia]
MERRGKGSEVYWKKVILKAPPSGGLSENGSGRWGWRIRRRRTRQVVLGGGRGRLLVLRRARAWFKRALKRLFSVVFRAWTGDYSKQNTEDWRRDAELLRSLNTELSLATAPFLFQ